METLLRTASAPPEKEAAPSVATGASQPMSPMAQAAADVFAARLRIAHVGPDDDFFDLGGGAIAAASVAKRLGKAIGRPVTPALIYQARTPRRLGAVLEGQRQAETSHLIDLNASLSGSPEMFCMPEVYGRPASFITLADRLHDIPVVGLAIGPAASDLIASESMETLVDAYVSAIRERRPAGPYRIAAYSFGGNFAQEIACRLHEDGEDVSLILIDATNRVTCIRPFKLIIAGVTGLLSSVLREGPRRAVGRSRRVMRILPAYLRRDKGGLPNWVPESDREISVAHVRAGRRHEPRPFYGRTLMIVCREQVEMNVFRNADGLLGWSGLLKGSIRRVVANVGHQEVMRDDYIDRLANEIRSFLR